MSPERAAFAAMMRQHQTGGMLPHFQSSVAYQRGRGLGGLIGSLVRRVIPFFSKPIVKKGLRNIGKTAATALLDAGQKALAAENPTPFKKALAQTSRAETQKLIKSVLKRKAPVKKTVPIKRRRTTRGKVSFNQSRARRGAKRGDIFNTL